MPVSFVEPLPAGLAEEARGELVRAFSRPGYISLPTDLWVLGRTPRERLLLAAVAPQFVTEDPGPPAVYRCALRLFAAFDCGRPPEPLGEASWDGLINLLAGRLLSRSFELAAQEPVKLVFYPAATEFAWFLARVFRLGRDALRELGWPPVDVPTPAPEEVEPVLRRMREVSDRQGPNYRVGEGYDPTGLSPELKVFVGTWRRAILRLHGIVPGEVIRVDFDLADAGEFWPCPGPDLGEIVALSGYRHLSPAGNIRAWLERRREAGAAG